ncbi:hypothetical protein ACR2WG_26895, partial [Klebsiella pneumoniae]
PNEFMSRKEGQTKRMPAHVIIKTANREVEIREEESQIPTYLHALAAENSFTIPTSSEASTSAQST